MAHVVDEVTGGFGVDIALDGDGLLCIFLMN